MPDAVIVDAVHTPIGKRNGSLAEVHPVDLSAAVLSEPARTGIDPALVDYALWGCVNQVGDQAAQIGRYAVLAAGWPETVPGVTVNRACGSSQSSFDFAAASAVLIATPERAAELGLTPIARYHSGAVSGADPLMMLTGPIPATAKVLKRSGLGIGDIGTFEVNEAFAPVPLAWQAEFGVDLDRLGGAIAVGHPPGASGTVLMTRLLHHIREYDIRYGLQTMCEGGGTANATIVELLT